ncbi:MAG: hypothetical protein HQM15_05795 [Deltaproteobacteria bacterium]|nr:hypothetical protein [Deltaproteobacteria bacterium]
MKKLLKLAGLGLFLLSFLVSQKSFAQYYPGYYDTWSAPIWGGYSLYGCLKGSDCSSGDRAATITGLGVTAIDLGVSSYLNSKANEKAIQEMQYKADAAKEAYNPQRIQDFQNIQKLNSFFLDTPVSPTTPTVQSSHPNNPGAHSPQITPAPQSRELRP